MTVEELLLELRDIQAPVEPGWWLLAPGYLGLICLLAMVAAGIGWFYKKRKINRLLHQADQELQRIGSSYRHDQDSHGLALELSKWLKQVSLMAFPEQQIEGLTGRPWLEFLDRSTDDARFTSGVGKIFGGLVYREQSGLDAGQLVALCQQWLAAVKPHLLAQGRY